MARSQSSCFRPTLEVLEDRVVPYSVSAYKWGNLSLSASFMPDGTKLGTYSNDLFVKYDGKFSTARWQREFARALQTWATVAPVDFHFVSDSGALSGSTGKIQGDSRFGDIRLGAYPSTSTYLAYAYVPYTTTTKGGDIVLNSRYSFNIGTNYDLYSVLLHESGHALGLSHSSLYGAVMYGTLSRVFSGLTADDLAGIRVKYGARKPDAYDAQKVNDSISSATNLAVDSSGALSLKADLTTVADVDYYKLIVPDGSDGTLTVTLDARNLSFLIPKLSVYNEAQQLVTSANAGAAYGSAVTLNLTGLYAGQTYYLAADGATTDVFGMSGYQLSALFGGLASPTTTDSSTSTTTSSSSGGTTGSSSFALADEDCDCHDHDHTQTTSAGFIGFVSAASFAPPASPGTSSAWLEDHRSFGESLPAEILESLSKGRLSSPSTAEAIAEPLAASVSFWNQIGSTLAPLSFLHELFG